MTNHTSKFDQSPTCVHAVQVHAFLHACKCNVHAHMHVVSHNYYALVNSDQSPHRVLTCIIHVGL